MGTPRCPNHLVPLNDCVSEGKGKGIGICPISGWHFSYQEDYLEGEGEAKIDKFGHKTTTFKYTQIDGGGIGG